MMRLVCVFPGSLSVTRLFVCVLGFDSCNAAVFFAVVGVPRSASLFTVLSPCIVVLICLMP